ncbi:MAG: conserved exported protein of unknown function [Candidatus Thorarchaeota archaeon]|nr:MAG: conserved exported protein of unknown function [Candidatus Thorarchaeota archaeon]
MSTKNQVLTLTILFVLTSFGPMIQAIPIGGEVPVCIAEETPSVVRTWNEVTLIYPDQFHDYGMIQEELAQFEAIAPHLVSIESFGKSSQGLDLNYVVITNEVISGPKSKTLIVAHHHGREQITIEMALRFIQHLLSQYAIDDTITSYVDNIEIYIIPTLNPDTLEYVINQGDHWLRKNINPYDEDGDGLVDEDSPDDVDGDGIISQEVIYHVDPVFGYVIDYSGWEGIDNDGDGEINEDPIGHVDLNRNYDVFWDLQTAGSDDVYAQDYRGEEPFSENETRAFRSFALQHKFTAAYSLHSGVNATYLSTDADQMYVEPIIYDNVMADFNNMLPRSFNKPIGPPYVAVNDKLSLTVEADESGLWREWMYHKRDTVLPVTFEIYTNHTAPDLEEHIQLNSTHTLYRWNGIYEYFNPDEQYIQSLWEDVSPAFDYLLNVTPKFHANLEAATNELGNGSQIRLHMEMDIESPYFGSQEGIEIITDDGELLKWYMPIGPVQVVDNLITLDLPTSFLNEEVVIHLGNNWTGYKTFTITTQQAQFIITPEIYIIIGIAVVALVAAIFRKRR